MGFAPLVRQKAYSHTEFVGLLSSFHLPCPSKATIHGDSDSDTESDAGWYPDEYDIEKGQSYTESTNNRYPVELSDTESDAGWYPEYYHTV